MPTGIQGSFNLCDVRDLAAGTIAAVDKGRVGECYILANAQIRKGGVMPDIIKTMEHDPF